mgnify:CR=1 FL=1|jgi:hypothetical protein
MDVIKDFFLNFGSLLPNYQTSFQRLFSLGLTLFLMCLLYFIFKNKSIKAKKTLLKFFAVLILLMQIAYFSVLVAMDEILLKNVFIPTSFNFIVMIFVVLTLVIPYQSFLDGVVPLAFIAGISYMAFPSSGLNLTPITMHSLATIVSNYSLFLFASLALTLKVCKFSFNSKWVPYFLVLSTTIYYCFLITLIIKGYAGFFFQPSLESLQDILFPFEIVMLAFVIILIETCYRLKAYFKKRKTEKENLQGK